MYIFFLILSILHNFNLVSSNNKYKRYSSLKKHVQACDSLYQKNEHNEKLVLFYLFKNETNPISDNCTYCEIDPVHSKQEYDFLLKALKDHPENTLGFVLCRQYRAFILPVDMIVVKEELPEKNNNTSLKNLVLHTIDKNMLLQDIGNRISQKYEILNKP